MKNKGIYLDYAATTPVDKKVIKAMKPFYHQKFGNFSSLHSFGREASEAVTRARRVIAGFFNAHEDEIVFTSGATEANNLAIKGAVKAYYSARKKYFKIVPKPHIITTAFEHHCVLDSVKTLEREGLAEAAYLLPDKEGLISPQSVKQAIKPNTILISVMYVNNEVGTVQPIGSIAKIIKSKNVKILFHTDATQAVNYFDCDVKKLGVDLLSMSAHKIYGPKGVGMLYVKKGAPVQRIQDGGSQEFGKRAGTVNSTGIIGFAEALNQIKSIGQSRISVRLKELRDRLIAKILKEIPKTFLNGSRTKRSPNNVNISFRDIEGESLLMMLDSFGIAASTGSACSSGSLSPSHVLLAMGLKPEEAHGSLRITLGKYTTQKEIDYTAAKLKIICEKLRKVSGNLLQDYYKEKQRLTIKN